MALPERLVAAELVWAEEVGVEVWEALEPVLAAQTVPRAQEAQLELAVALWQVLALEQA